MSYRLLYNEAEAGTIYYNYQKDGMAGTVHFTGDTYDVKDVFFNSRRAKWVGRAWRVYQLLYPQTEKVAAEIIEKLRKRGYVVKPEHVSMEIPGV